MYRKKKHTKKHQKYRCLRIILVYKVKTTGKGKQYYQEANSKNNPLNKCGGHGVIPKSLIAAILHLLH